MIICQLIMHLLVLISLNTCTSKFSAVCFSACDVTPGWAALSEAATLLMPYQKSSFQIACCYWCDFVNDCLENVWEGIVFAYFDVSALLL